MRPVARTPEELESLLEDAFLTRDAEALSEMFEEGAVLIAGVRQHEARGSGEIGRLARELWECDQTYLAEPRRVVQARGTALLLGNGALSVAHRGADGDWRYAIALLRHGQTNPKEEEL